MEKHAAINSERSQTRVVGFDWRTSKAGKLEARLGISCGSKIGTIRGSMARIARCYLRSTIYRGTMAGATKCHSRDEIQDVGRQ